nr:MAG TPA: hypothetical protein [Caudoviricetes sp.]
MKSFPRSLLTVAFLRWLLIELSFLYLLRRILKCSFLDSF